MASLPMDIIFSCVLPKLPVKSLTRFKCVSRSFLAEISSPEFMKLHHLNALSSDANRLLIVPGHNKFLNIYDLDSPLAPPLLLRYPKPLTFTDLLMSIVATCECYLLIGCGYTYLDGLILLNPSTRSYRELPHLVINVTLSNDPWYGMCHILDGPIDDYKVVRFRDSGEGREVMVYSLRTNLWNLVDLRETVESSRIWPATLALAQNHLLHMIFCKYDDNGKTHMSRIGCFDMKVERWTHDVQLPANTFSDVNDSDVVSLWVLDGQLCFSVQNVNESTYDVWVMKEYGVKESWVKLMSLPNCDDDPEKDREELFNPIAYRKGLAHEVLCWGSCSGDFIWYNLRNRQGIKAEFPRLPDSRWPDAYICKGSLLNIPGGQLITNTWTEEKEDEEEEYEGEEEDDDDFVGMSTYVP